MRMKDGLHKHQWYPEWNDNERAAAQMILNNVLDVLDEIKMCVAYELDGKKIDYLPAAVEDQIKIKPIYETFPGWKVSTSGVKNMDSLPENAKKYIFAVEDFIGAKVSSISTSPERDDTILIENPFEV